MNWVWPIRRQFWNALVLFKYRSNKPASIPVPQDGMRPLKAVTLAERIPGVPIGNIKVADHIPKDEASTAKYLFYQFQVAMYRWFPAQQDDLPPVDADTMKALDQVRRGLPYGPTYDPRVPYDGVERGLLGLFINVSLKDQYEFIMKEWVNKGTFAPGLRGSRCPIAGDNEPSTSHFTIPMDGEEPRTITGFARFTRTRGGAYCFLPSMTALRFLASH